MLVQLPDFYDDELVYSLICRCFINFGYANYDTTIEHIFSDAKAIPSIDLINRYTIEFYQMLTDNNTMADIIVKHTMYPYYSRLIPKPTRKKILLEMASIRCNYSRFQFSKIKKQIKSLKYCPICAQSDRATIGQTYWRRIHQTDTAICAKHYCYLKSIPLDADKRKTLIPAEIVIPDDDIINYCENQQEKEEAAKLDKMLNTIDL